jgi:hypothetical protein
VKALIVANEYLESEVCDLMQAVSHACARGRFNTYSGLQYVESGYGRCHAKKVMLARSPSAAPVILLRATSAMPK